LNPTNEKIVVNKKAFFNISYYKKYLTILLLNSLSYNNLISGKNRCLSKHPLFCIVDFSR
jgi:hypothetical protein